MKRIASLFLACVMTMSSVSYAEPTVQPTQDQTAVVSPLKKGQAAPYTGVLFSPGATASLIADISTNAEKLAIEVEKAVKVAEAKKDFEKSELKTTCDADKKIIQAEATANAQKLRAVEEALKKSEAAAAAAPNRTLWAGIGFGGGIAVTVLTVFALNKATK